MHGIWLYSHPLCYRLGVCDESKGERRKTNHTKIHLNVLFMRLPIVWIVFGLRHYTVNGMIEKNHYNFVLTNLFTKKEKKQQDGVATVKHD